MRLQPAACLIQSTSSQQAQPSIWSCDIMENWSSSLHATDMTKKKGVVYHTNIHPIIHPHLVVGVVAATAELVPALRAAEVHAAALRQSVLEPAVRTCCGKMR